MMELPLKGLTVLEFSQYLSGPSAGLRLADLGARVIKIERPGTGDAGRKLAIKDLWVDDSSLLFHTINRNKESYCADLKNEEDLLLIRKLIQKSDVMIHNFRPGVMKKCGLDFESVQKFHPKIIYAEISGYGRVGPWKDKPGQDLLLQSMTGLAYTTGDGTNGPVPFGIAIADILCGAQLVQGILAALIRRQKKGKGALVEISLMESLLDFQFELLTTYFAGKKQPERSTIGNGHPLLSAPYGVYATADGHIAFAMMDIHVLADAISCAKLREFPKEQAFSRRDEIKKILCEHLVNRTSNYWISQLHAYGLWAMEVLDWEQMMHLESYRCLEMEQLIVTKNKPITTTRCPIRINGKKIFSKTPAPQLGEHTASINRELVNTDGI